MEGFSVGCQEGATKTIGILAVTFVILLEYEDMQYEWILHDLICGSEII